uniref:Candidate secreted effector n=1 Tax=Meloidogyne incognita TaxID=6306 RepID=A0A914KK27_MELIC
MIKEELEQKPPTPAFGVPAEIEVKEEKEEEDIDEAMLDMSDKILRITANSPLCTLYFH